MTARTGMSDILAEVRTLAECGTAEYTLGTVTYWTDDQLQAICDRHRYEFAFEPLTCPVPVYGTAGYQYFDHYVGAKWIEGTMGTTVAAVFYLQNSTGSFLSNGTAIVGTIDYTLGRVTFTSDQGGTVSYATGRAYDINAAAAEVWTKKAAHYAPSSFDFSTDNMRVNRSQVYEHCRQQADYYRGLSGNGVSTLYLGRDDDYRSD